VPVLLGLCLMQLCIIWLMSNIVGGLYLVFLMLEEGLFLILYQGHSLEELQLFSLILSIWFVPNWLIR